MVSGSRQKSSTSEAIGHPLPKYIGMSRFTSTYSLNTNARVGTYYIHMYIYIILNCICRVIDTDWLNISPLRQFAAKLLNLQ